MIQLGFLQKWEDAESPIMAISVKEVTFYDTSFYRVDTGYLSINGS